LAENTRVLKVFVIEEGETKVYPFIVDKIIDKRDSHFSVYKEITASGLAFAELGKTGLRLELNKDVVELDYKKDKNTVATLNYWLDKVFPRDESGHWLPLGAMKFVWIGQIIVMRLSVRLIKCTMTFR
jgi:hypothetical protein